MGLRLLEHAVNRKGAAARRHQSHQPATTSSDADTEYDPGIRVLIKPILKGLPTWFSVPSWAAACVFFWHSIGNYWLTLFSNMVTDLNLTDMETCYKAVPARHHSGDAGRKPLKGPK
jgi:hypothetical protein